MIYCKYNSSSLYYLFSPPLTFQHTGNDTTDDSFEMSNNKDTAGPIILSDIATTDNERDDQTMDTEMVKVVHNLTHEVRDLDFGVDTPSAEELPTGKDDHEAEEDAPQGQTEDEEYIRSPTPSNISDDSSIPVDMSDTSDNDENASITSEDTNSAMGSIGRKCPLPHCSRAGCGATS
ncbi:MAG TPA: hypothetical protein VGO47_03935 [Chlamydiales bacterium]|nr:hypothetical protein [Chlamydiales bacterium]